MTQIHHRELDTAFISSAHLFQTERNPISTPWQNQADDVGALPAIAKRSTFMTQRNIPGNMDHTLPPKNMMHPTSSTDLFNSISVEFDPDLEDGSQVCIPQNDRHRPARTRKH